MFLMVGLFDFLSQLSRLFWGDDYGGVFVYSNSSFRASVLFSSPGSSYKARIHCVIIVAVVGKDISFFIHKMHNVF